MNELKTLKDIEWSHVDSELIKDDIKQDLGITWIKELETQKKKENNAFCFKCKASGAENFNCNCNIETASNFWLCDNDFDAVINFLKYIHNIGNEGKKVVAEVFQPDVVWDGNQEKTQ